MSQPSAAVPANRPKKKSRLYQERWGYIFLIPWFIFFCIFTVYPFVFGIAVSFTDYSLKGANYTGLKNYLDIFKDIAFSRSVIATFEYAAIVIPIVILLSLWVAKTLQPLGKAANGITKLICYFPSVTNQIALAVVWGFTFAPTFGLIAGIMTKLGMPPISWFDAPYTAIPILSLLVVTCSMGQPVILYSAAMNNIPISYYEAANIDGATNGQMFRKITIPLLRSTTTFILVTTTIGILQVFVVPYMMTSGGPEYKTSSLLLLIYKSAFLNGHFGYASAIGVILFIITAIVAAVQFKAMKADVVEY